MDESVCVIGPCAPDLFTLAPPSRVLAAAENVDRAGLLRKACAHYGVRCNWAEPLGPNATEAAGAAHTHAPSHAPSHDPSDEARMFNSGLMLFSQAHHLSMFRGEGAGASGFLDSTSRPRRPQASPLLWSNCSRLQAVDPSEPLEDQPLFNVLLRKHAVRWQDVNGLKRGGGGREREGGGRGGEGRGE